MAPDLIRPLVGSFFINVTNVAAFLSPQRAALIVGCFFNGSSVIDGAGGSISATSYAQLAVQGSKFYDSVASSGGAIDAVNAQVNVSTSELWRNRGLKDGGALSCRGSAALLLDNVTIHFGRAPYGGALSIFDSATVEMINVLVRNNNAESFPETSTIANAQLGGGAINMASPDASLIASFSIFHSNSALFSYGGGISVSSGSVRLLDSSFINNSAKISGGGLFLLGTSIALERCVFSGNSAEQGGGLYRTSLIEQRSTDFNLTGCTFQNNSAAETGGGIDFSSGVIVTSPVLISDSMFIGNRAVHGGAINIADPLRALFTNVSFQGNEAISSFQTPSGGGLDIPVGGGVSMSAFAEVRFNSSIFDSNSAQNGLGGALYITDRAGDTTGAIACVESVFMENIAKGGGGIYLAGNYFQLRSVFHGAEAPTNRYDRNQALYGADVASDGSRLDWFPAAQSQLRSFVRTGSELGLVLINNASVVSTIRVNLYDHFNQVVRWIAIPTTFVLALLDESRADLVGSTRATLNAQGDIAFIGVRAAGIFGNHSVQVSSDRAQAAVQLLRTPVFNFTLTACNPGELLTTGVQSQHGVCTRCAANEYGFDGISCRLCLSGAICREGAIQVL